MHISVSAVADSALHSLAFALDSTMRPITLIAVQLAGCESSQPTDGLQPEVGINGAKQSVFFRFQCTALSFFRQRFITLLH